MRNYADQNGVVRVRVERTGALVDRDGQTPVEQVW